MLIEETVKTKVTPNMVEYYRSKGYNWIKFDIDNGFVSYKGCQEPYKFN